MIAIETRQLAGGVVLHAFPEGKRAVPLPCVVFYHGFTSSSMVYSYFAVALDSRIPGSHAGCAGAWRSLRRRLTGTDTPILADSAPKHAGIYDVTCGDSGGKLAT